MKKTFSLLCTLFLSGSLLAQQLPTQGLVAHFPFSNSAQDVSGFNHNGTVYGATLTTDRFGNPNNAYHFDGNNQYIAASGINTLNTAQHTISVWVKAEQRNDALVNPYTAHPGTPHYYPNNIISNDLAAYSGHGLGLNITPNVNEFVTEYQSGFNAKQNLNFQANQWYHIVCQYQTGKLSVYINGVFSYSVNYSQDPYDGANSLNIGKHNEDAGYTTRRFFKGTIDDIRIYNRLLDSTEVKQLYHNDTISSQPTACQSINPINIQVSGNTMTASAGVTASYQWLLNGQPIAGATDSVYTPTQSGNYSVTYTSMYSPSFVYCTKTTPAIVFSLTSNKAKINNLFKSYPNPAQGTVFVEAMSSGKLSVLDRVGKVILSQEIVAGKNEINLSAFTKGLYIIQLETKDGVSSSKMSVE